MSNMNAPVFIREARLSDIDGLIPLMKELFSIEADFTFDEALQRRGLEMMLDGNESRCIMAAVSNEAIIGMASIQTMISTAEGGIVGLAEDVIVAANSRGMGIGCKLLRSLEVWAVRKGLKRIQLLADTQNIPALEFYQHLNWTKTQLICLRKKGF